MLIDGTVHPAFAEVARSLRRILPKNGKGGAAVCVYHEGRKVVDVWGGTRDDKGAPWEHDTLSVSFSTTKGIASTLLHVFIDRGLVDLDAPVARYWPEFAQAGKESVTVRQLLCHEAGLYAIADIIEHAHELLDWNHMIERLAAAEPAHAPGAAHGYHGLTYGYLVGEVVRRVADGRSFQQVLADEIVEPLGLDGAFCGVPESEQGRCARLMAPAWDAPAEVRSRRLAKAWAGARRWRDRLARVGIRYDPTQTLAALLPQGMDEIDFNSPEFRSACIPAANGMFTARSLAKLYACLAMGGELDGVRLLSQEAILRASQEQNRGAGLVMPISMRWRLGYHRVFTLGARVRGGFGHFGYGGSGGFADPKRKLAVALTVNSGVGTPFGDARIARIGGTAVRCADRYTA
jgi:CubicO group peptidase (beta-lactamase class C family)